MFAWKLLLQKRSKEPTRIDMSEVNWLHKTLPSVCSGRQHAVVLRWKLCCGCDNKIYRSFYQLPSMEISTFREKEEEEVFHLSRLTIYGAITTNIYLFARVGDEWIFIRPESNKNTNGNNTNGKKSLWKLLNLFNVPREYFFFPLECIFLIKASKRENRFIHRKKRIIYTQFSSARCLLLALSEKYLFV